MTVLRSVNETGAAASSWTAAQSTTISRARLAHGIALDTVWLLIPGLVCLVLLDLATIPPNDFWWHLRTGQIISQAHVIPNVDLFSFSQPGMPWTNQSWLMELFYYLVYQAGGLPLILLTHALTVTTGYVCLQAACLRVAPGQARAAALAVMAAALLGLVDWTVRPQSISFAAFGALVFILETDRRRSGRIIWLLPVLFGIWINAHGGFIFGLGLLGIYLLSRVGTDLLAQQSLTAATYRSLAAAGLTVLVLALNPGGPLGLIHYIFGFLASNATQNMNAEFMPLSLRETDGQLFAAFVILLLVLLHVRRRRLPACYVIIGLVFGAAALYSRRVLPWFGMAMAPALAWALAVPSAGIRGAAARRPGKLVLNYMLLGLLGLGLLASLPWFRAALPLPPDRRSYLMPHTTPVAATPRLCRLGSRARVFAEIGYASYLTWACPAVPIFMDTRFELYPSEMWQDYVMIGAGQFGWEKKLAGYGINAILAAKAQQSSLVAAVRSSPSWRTVYEDADTLLVVHE
jgi:hypothetical protein